MFISYETLAQAAVSIINLALFMFLLVKPRRFSGKATMIIAASGSILLYLPEIFLPALENILLPQIWILSLCFLYWILCIAGQYGLIFLLSKRSWLRSCFLIMVWDALTSVILTVFTGITGMILGSASPVDIPAAAILALTLISGLLSAIFLKGSPLQNADLSSRVSGICVILYTLARILLTSASLLDNEKIYRESWIAAVLIICIVILGGIILAWSSTRIYLRRKIVRFTPPAGYPPMDRSRGIVLDEFLRKCLDSRGFSLHINDQLHEDAVSGKRLGILICILYLCMQILTCSSNRQSRHSQEMDLYMTIQRKMNYIILSAECRPIHGQLKPPGLSSSIFELLLNQLLSSRQGYSQYLDNSRVYRQICVSVRL